MKRKIGQMKVSEAIPVLKIAASQFGLKLTNTRHLRAIVRIVENSATSN